MIRSSNCTSNQREKIWVLLKMLTWKKAGNMHSYNPHVEWSDNMPFMYCLLSFLYFSIRDLKHLHASSYIASPQNLDLKLENSEIASAIWSAYSRSKSSNTSNRLLKSNLSFASPPWDRCRSHRIHCRESSFLSCVTLFIHWNASSKLELVSIFPTMKPKLDLCSNKREVDEREDAATMQAFLNGGLSLAINLIAMCNNMTNMDRCFLNLESAVFNEASFSFSFQQWRAIWAKPSHLWTSCHVNENANNWKNKCEKNGMQIDAPMNYDYVTPIKLYF